MIVLLKSIFYGYDPRDRIKEYEKTIAIIKVTDRNLKIFRSRLKILTNYKERQLLQ